MAPQRNRRPGFSRRAQYTLFLGYVVAGIGAFIGIALLLLARIDPPIFAGLRGGVREATAPVSSLMVGARDSLFGIPGAIGAHFGTVSENNRLKTELAKSDRLVTAARSLMRENQRLRRLLAVRDAATRPVVAARLVSSSGASTRRFAILNAGSAQGVRPGQPLRGPEGLIGRVTETSPNTARILLLIDADSIVPVRRTRDGLPAIVAGRGDGMVEVRSASIANAPLLAGDVFVSSGTGGIYPPGVPVARVTRSARDIAPGRPFANPDALDFALVLDSFLPPPPAPPRASAAP